MKKVSELALLTLFFSSLAGLGFTAGVISFIGFAQMMVGILP
ncbi:hypothetical protein [Enterobacter ludwigii]|nr:hypothetical protein [Enterobacter ludwigii]KLP40835.1 sodium:solute symporter [Enterobacter ludwigii]